MCFLDDHDPCRRECPYSTCGLIIRFIQCSRVQAVRERCVFGNDEDGWWNKA